MNTDITKDILYCQALLNNNEVVAIPTETVYGLAACIDSDATVEQIFRLKSRPHYNPLIVHIHHIDQLNNLAVDIPENALQLAEVFWPGPLTLLLKKGPQVSDLITAGKPTIAVRMPNHPLTIELLKGLKAPIAAPSANPFTGISPTSAEHVYQYFKGKIKAVLDGGPCEVGLESTIVGFDGETAVIYRKGGISINRIESVIGEVSYIRKTKSTKIVAPGMLDKHYSPKTKLILTKSLEKELSKHLNKKVGVITLSPYFKSDIALCTALSATGNLDEAASQLYATLHFMDTQNLDIIIAEIMPETDLGVTINDRLKRASYH
ncbi:MAG: threonylcarbamoyl-AMP synthase [Winogradskyella sp.]|nr:threonylcarbamoyl-AMP synthase [Winogradskyella sp.]